MNEYCKDLNVKIIFSPFKLSTMFSPKDFVPDSVKSRVLYQFTCASCGARYIGKLKPIGILTNVLMRICCRSTNCFPLTLAQLLLRQIKH